MHLRGDVDAIVFSAGIGERSVVVRRLICEGLERFGIEIDEAKNEDVKKKGGEISKDGSPIKVSLKLVPAVLVIYATVQNPLLFRHWGSEGGFT